MLSPQLDYTGLTLPGIRLNCCGTSLAQSEIGTVAVDYLVYSGYLVLADLWPRAGKLALQQLASRAGMLIYSRLFSHTWAGTGDGIWCN